MKKIVIAIFTLFLMVNAASAATTYVSTAAELAAAIANQPISNDITLSNSITLAVPNTNIEISQDMTIRASGASISGSGASIFRVTQSAVVTFDSIVFKNSGGAGSAVSVGGTANVTFGNCKFEDNTTTNNGAALNISGGTVTFSGPNSFLNNNATGSGGAVFVDGGTVNFPSGVTFTQNAAGNGGALAVAGIATANLNGNIFRDNRANLGGAVHVASTATLTLNGTVAFTENKAQGAAGNGGAVYFAGSGSISGGSFAQNTATGSGAGVYAVGALSVSGGTFSANAANVSGGAVYTGASATVSGGTFTGNSAVNSGGAVYAATTARITAGTFQNNRTSGTGLNYGGGAVWGNRVEIAPSAVSMTFEGNTSAADGGAIFSMTDIVGINTLFLKNEGFNGGAVSSLSLSSFDNCVFEENLASNSGGGINAGTLNATRTSFLSNNSASGSGGGVFLGVTGSSFIGSSLFDSNRVRQNGGALFLSGNQHNLRVNTTVFNGNYAASNQGGAVSAAGNDILFSRCTFTNNVVEAGANAQGGALYLNTPTFKLLNCTFHRNEAGSGRGGAVALGSASGSTSDSVIFFSTFTDNLAGGGRGGALYTEAGRINLVGSAYVGNSASYGDDIFGGNSSTGAINSQGYNILGVYGMMGASGPSNNVDWAAALNVAGQNRTLDRFGPEFTRALLFGSSTPAANPPDAGSPVFVGSTLRTTQTLNSIALAPTTVSSTNPALDSIPGSTALNLFSSYFAGIPFTDVRGVSRPVPANGNCDVGAYESGDGSTPPPPGQDVIAYVKMGGIPNTLKKIGQTTTMTAIVFYRNGTSSSSEPVNWSSSNPGVARIDSFGRLVSLQQGKTTITVTTQRLDAENRHATDSAVLEVTDEMSFTNVHPDVWKRLGAFNDLMQKNGQQLFFFDSDPSIVERPAFQSSFETLYGVKPAQLTEFLNVNDIAFDSSASFNGSNWNSARPSLKVTLDSVYKGDLLPLEYTYSLSWAEVSGLLERKVTRIENDTELFGKLKIVFQNTQGATHPVVDADGEYGIAVAKAVSSGALSVTNGNNGLTLTLRAFLGDANGDKPALMESRLVVPDGAADGKVAGSMWLLKRTGGSGGDTTSGGGGGCNSGLGLLTVLFAAGYCLKRRSL